MLEAVMKYGVIFYAMGIVFAIGVVSKIVSHITARKMVKAASEIQKSNHRLMRLLKAKFEHASMVSDKVQNVEVFVKKYLYEYKVLGVRFDTWRSMRQKTIWIILTLGIWGIFTSYQMEGMGEQTIRYVGATGTLTILLYSIHILSNESARVEVARTYIVDYLENVCIHRYEKIGSVQPEPELVLAEEEPDFEEEPEVTKDHSSQEMRLRAILEEFLA